MISSMMPSSLSGTAAITAAWIVTGFVVSGMVALAAAVAHHLARRALPSRLVWAVALLTTLGVVLSLPLRMAPVGDGDPIPMATATLAVPEGAHTSTDWPARLATAAGSAITAMDRQLHHLVSWSADIAATAPAWMQWTIVLFWPATTVILLGVLALSYRRQARALRGAPHAHIGGVPVQVTDVNGPVVFGVLAPRILVPSWLFARDPEEQMLVVQHERTHIEARDPLLLIAACTIAVLLPWNLPVWFMFSRLRLAIEFDCDARVLARGVSARRYGKLLIDLSAEPAMTYNPSRVPICATAFSYRASHLERRLRTMTSRSTRFLLLRRASVITFGGLAMLAACRAELPTSAELQAMDVASAEQHIGRVTTIDDATTEYFIDGKRVDRAEATGLTADRIATIEVRKGRNGDQVFVVTGQRSAGASVAAAGEASRITVRRKDSLPIVLGERNATREDAPVIIGSSGKTFEGLILVDGVRRTQADLAKISPSTIESVEVVKGPTAVAQYGPEGANGVIRVLTKK